MKEGLYFNQTVTTPEVRHPELKLDLHVHVHTGTCSHAHVGAYSPRHTQSHYVLGLLSWSKMRLLQSSILRF